MIAEAQFSPGPRMALLVQALDAEGCFDRQEERASFEEMAVIRVPPWPRRFWRIEVSWA